MNRTHYWINLLQFYTTINFGMETYVKLQYIRKWDLIKNLQLINSKNQILLRFILTKMRHFRSDLKWNAALNSSLIHDRLSQCTNCKGSIQFQKYNCMFDAGKFIYISIIRLIWAENTESSPLLWNVFVWK